MGAAGRLERKIAFLILFRVLFENLHNSKHMFSNSMFCQSFESFNDHYGIYNLQFFNISDIVYILCLITLREPWRSLKCALSFSLSLIHGGLFLYVFYNFRLWAYDLLGFLYGNSARPELRIHPSRKNYFRCPRMQPILDHIVFCFGVSWTRQVVSI